ncbi:MAG: Hsp70 family protein [Defluviitaleaceae bacterium]|nr:Hsp70 family protein [Defluviitaleaceae bacterium]
MADFVFGIDLGTTYSCIAYVDESGKPVVIQNSEGENTTPSVVGFTQEGAVVGEIAKQTAAMDPDNTVSFVKRLMGEQDFAIHFDGEDKSPEDVSALILKRIAEDASKMINAEVRDVVITCPAYFGDSHRIATKNAGIIAGLNVMAVINEPTAAALFYGVSKDQGKKTILVYDLGGGTFDVTIMDINDGRIEVICSEGNHELGGKDWDESLMHYIYSKFVEETGYSGDFDASMQHTLRLKAETAKQQLSRRESTVVMFDAAGLMARVEVTKSTFNELTSALLEQTIDETDKAIAIAKGKGYTVTDIILVGGSTRMSQVEETLIAKYRMTPQLVDPDEAVAKGAALHALYLAQKENELPPPPGETKRVRELPPGPRIEIDIVHATTKSYALEVLVNDEAMWNNLIIKNNPLINNEINAKEQYGTNTANAPSVVLKVYENDFMDEYFEIKPNQKILGDAVLNLSGDLPKGAPIEVTFSLNSEGLLTITGRDLTNGAFIESHMQIEGSLTPQQIKEKTEKIGLTKTQ